MSILIRAVGTVSVIGAAVIGPALIGPVASADPPPNCSSADMAGVMSGVSAAMSAYLFTHPDVNAFITGLKGVPKEQRREQIRSYGDAHPVERAEIQAIRQPMADFHARCGGGQDMTP